MTGEILDGETGTSLTDARVPDGPKVDDDTPPTEAIRIRAGIRPDDHGLKVREIGHPDAWLATTDHVEVRR